MNLEQVEEFIQNKTSRKRAHTYGHLFFIHLFLVQVFTGFGELVMVLDTVKCK